MNDLDQLWIQGYLYGINAGFVLCALIVLVWTKGRIGRGGRGV